MDKNKTIKKRREIMKKFTPLAMKCSQKDWDSIKGRLEGYRKSMEEFIEGHYLTNYFCGTENNIANITQIIYNEEIHETFNAKIFLNACVIDCDVYEITKEQIIILNTDGNNDVRKCMKQWFPDAFKKELVVGNWIIKDNDSPWIVYIDKQNNVYGIDTDGEWFSSSKPENTIQIMLNNPKNRKATPQEVEAALICEAKKRGFVKNTSYTITNGDGVINSKDSERFCFDEYGNKLLFNNWSIFEQGIWATIIETITIQEAEKLLNKKIV